MPYITRKSRYKEYGLVVYYEYSDALRNADAIPEREVVTTMHRDTSFESELDLIEHTVKQGETIHRLALHYYRDAKMWWFIADYNPNVDYQNLQSGDVLIIPPNTEVNAY